MKCYKCGEEIGAPEWVWTKFFDGKKRPICEWCALAFKENVDFRSTSGVRFEPVEAVKDK